MVQNQGLPAFGRVAHPKMAEPGHGGMKAEETGLLPALDYVFANPEGTRTLPW